MPHVIAISQVAALYSTYFLNIFYGEYKEGREKFVEIEDVCGYTLQRVIVDNILVSNRSTKRNSSELKYINILVLSTTPFYSARALCIAVLICRNVMTKYLA